MDWSNMDFPSVVSALAVALSFFALILLMVLCFTSPQVPPIYLSRRLFAAHLFSCLFMELRKSFVWSDFGTWTLALHVLYFGLCERGQLTLTRLLHGPSFGGSHAIFMTYLFNCLTEPSWSTKTGTMAFFELWLHLAPVLLHWGDGFLNFLALQKAYSPPMSQGSWESSMKIAPALYYAASRVALRLWAAAVGYMILEKVFRAATDPTNGSLGVSEWDWSLQKLIQISDIREVLPLASTIMAYTLFTHRLFVTPEEPEKKA